jgi:hypothetical protein
MEEEDKIIEDLILKGALEVSGIDIETGEPLYNFTHKLKDVSPELDQEIQTFFSQEMMFLWENGFVEMDITEKNPIVKLTDKAFNAQEVLKLDKNKQYTLKDIIRQLRK